MAACGYCLNQSSKLVEKIWWRLSSEGGKNGTGWKVPRRCGMVLYCCPGRQEVMYCTLSVRYWQSRGKSCKH